MDIINLDDLNIYDFGNEIQLGGLIWTGKGMALVTQFPGKNEDFSNLQSMPMDLPQWERLLKQTDTLETEIFATDPTGKVVKAIFRKTQRSIDSYVQWAVFQRDNYTCRYCGRTGIPLTVDHIDLWENGGASIEVNLLSACRNCNKDRGRIEYDVWLKSPVYAKRSANLSVAQRQANEDVVAQLPHLRTLRVQHVRSR